MDNNTGFESDGDYGDEDYEEGTDDEGTEEVFTPPTPKEKFAGFCQQVLALHDRSGNAYGQLYDIVAPFDKELAAKLKACQVADEALIAYCRTKAEVK